MENSQEFLFNVIMYGGGVLVLVVIWVVLSQFISNDGPKGPVLPSTPLELLEYLLINFGSQENQKKSYEKELYEKLSRKFQLDEQLSLLRIQDRFRKYNEIRNSRYLRNFKDTLFEFKKDSTEIRLYYILYDYLTAIFEANEANRLAFSTSSISSGLEFITMGVDEAQETFELRSDVYGLIQLLEECKELGIQLNGASIEMNKNSENSDKFQHVFSLGKKVKELYNKIEPYEKYLSVETNIVTEYLNLLHDEAKKLREIPPKVVSPSLPDPPEYFPLNISENRYDMIRGQKKEISLKILNVGDVLCDNVSVSINIPSDTQTQIILDKPLMQKGDSTQLGSIASKQDRILKFSICSNCEEDRVTLFIHLRYRKPGAAGKENYDTRQFNFTISLTSPLDLADSPYSTAQSTRKIKSFYGRERIKRGIITELRRLDSGQIIGLFGLARIGKTALLNEIMEDSGIADDNIFIYYNTVDNTKSIPNQNQWLLTFLDELFKMIETKVKEADIHLSYKKNFEKESPVQKIISLLSGLEEELTRKEKFVVIIIDEYQTIEEDFTSYKEKDTLSKHEVIRMFKLIGMNTSRVSLILSGYHDIYTLRTFDTYWSEYLDKGFKPFQMGHLEKEATLKLISLPMEQHQITFESPAVPEQIYRWTRGFPWYTQLIGEELFELMKTKANRNNVITQEHLDQIIIKLFHSGEAQQYDRFFRHPFVTPWARLTFLELIIHIIARGDTGDHLELNGLHYMSSDNVYRQLEAQLGKVNKMDFIRRIESLERKKVLESREIPDKSNKYHYAISIPLLAMWHRKRGKIESLLSEYLGYQDQPLV